MDTDRILGEEFIDVDELDELDELVKAEEETIQRINAQRHSARPQNAVLWAGHYDRPGGDSSNGGWG